MQNDAYRLRIVLPLLELLHHHCINQESIQHAAEHVGTKFASCLLRPAHQFTASSEDTALAVSASTAMVLEYRTLFGQSMVDFDQKVLQQRTVPNAIDASLSQPSTAIPCPMPTSPMAAKRLPSSGLHFDMRSEPEDFDLGAQSLYLTSPLFGSPLSDDMDSAFSGSSIEMEDSKSTVECEDVDADLAHAVDSLFLESTSDLLFTNQASGSIYRSMPGHVPARSAQHGVMSY